MIASWQGRAAKVEVGVFRGKGEVSYIEDSI